MKTHNKKMHSGKTKRMGNEREEFSPKTKEHIAREAMYICSAPDCYRFTGYTTSEGKPRTIAQGAHILPAGEKGPRAGKGLDKKYLKSAKNGIWLCSICHKKIDDEPQWYTEEMLQQWKKDHIELLKRLVGKDIEAALLELRGQKRHHQEVREFLSFMDDRRMLYEGMDMEFPPRVLESVELMRSRVIQTRAQVTGNQDVSKALSQIQTAINEFLSGVGSEIDLKTLRCDSRDPKWVHFSEELRKFRKAIVIILKVLAGDSDYELHWER